MDLLNTIGGRVAVMLYGRLPMSLKREEGQGLVEYALIIALIAIALVAALGFLKDDIAGAFDKIGSSLPGS